MSSPEERLRLELKARDDVLGDGVEGLAWAAGIPTVAPYGPKPVGVILDDLHTFLASVRCRHCGSIGEPGTDHTCPCPKHDNDCAEHLPWPDTMGLGPRPEPICFNCGDPIPDFLGIQLCSECNVLLEYEYDYGVRHEGNHHQPLTQYESEDEARQKLWLCLNINDPHCFLVRRVHTAWERVSDG